MSDQLQQMRVRENHPYCFKCGTNRDLTVDYIIPLAHGGATDDPA